MASPWTMSATRSKTTQEALRAGLGAARLDAFSSFGGTSRRSETGRRWSFEPGHTAAQFTARHMMVTWVRGAFKDVHGRVDFDLDDCMQTSFEGVIDAAKLWTGESDRDAHLRSADSSTSTTLKIAVEAILDDDLRTVGLEEAVYPG